MASLFQLDPVGFGKREQYYATHLHAYVQAKHPVEIGAFLVGDASSEHCGTVVEASKNGEEFRLWLFPYKRSDYERVRAQFATPGARLVVEFSPCDANELIVWTFAKTRAALGQKRLHLSRLFKSLGLLDDATRCRERAFAMAEPLSLQEMCAAGCARLGKNCRVPECQERIDACTVYCFSYAST